MCSRNAAPARSCGMRSVFMPRYANDSRESDVPRPPMTALDSLAQAACERAASYREALVEATRRLVSIPTENPPGDNYESCRDLLAEMVDAIGLEPRRVEDCLRAEHGTGAPAVYFHG